MYPSLWLSTRKHKKLDTGRERSSTLFSNRESVKAFMVRVRKLLHVINIDFLTAVAQPFLSCASVCQRQILSVAKSELFSVDQHLRASDYHAVTETTTDRPKAPFSLFFPDGCRVAHRSDANGGLTGCMPEERRDPRERGCKECEAKEWYRAEKEEKKPVLLSFRSLQTLRPSAVR